jgi:addiction module RelE/StbE family toxin
MSGMYKVYWASVAEDDLKEIIEYIAQDSSTTARNMLEKIRAKASALDQFPERGRIVPELKEHGIILYRELIVSPWRIVYRVSENKVFVLSVLDSRRNVQDILLKRLIK